MNENLTDISVVLDRSGSMSLIKDDTIGGYNEFLKGQRGSPGKATVSLYQFDDVYETVYEGKDVREAPELTPETFQPRGATARLDAIGRTIDATGVRLAKTPEGDRPARVLVVILTDGGENASKGYTCTRVKGMVEHQTDAYKWQFVFIGANQDAVTSGAGLGISASNTLAFAATGVGTRNTMAKLSADVSLYRSAPSASANAAPVFTNEGRDECMAGKK